MAYDQLASSMQELYVGSPRVSLRVNGRRRSRNAWHRQCSRAMEDKQWRSHLPDEVLSRILAFLPLISILRCRLVGKRWNALSQQALFQETYARVSGELSCQYIQLLETSRGLAGSQLISSVGDLLLVTSFAEASDHLYVVNPTTATLKLIPAMLRDPRRQQSFSVVGMVKNSESNVYSILAAQEGARPVRFQVYDSSRGSWEWAGTWAVRQPWSRRELTSNLIKYIHEECLFGNPISFHLLGVALHEGNLHCLSVGASRHFHILRFDQPSNRWQELPGIFPPCSSSFVCDFRCRPVLFESKGRLMLAAAQVTGPTSIRVNVWRYESGAALWTEGASAEQMMKEEESDACGSVSYADSTFFYLDASGEYLCLGAFPNLRNPDPKVLLYSILEDSWLLSKLREDEAENKVVYWQKRAFFFEPRWRS